MCPFCIMAAILDFRALKRDKNWHPFFLMSISYTKRIRRVFAFIKKYTKFYFMTHAHVIEPIRTITIVVSRTFARYPKLLPTQTSHIVQLCEIV